MKQTIQFLNQILDDHDALIVACSSGPDSMCLMTLLLNLPKNLKIICAHVNHKVRKQSEKEYRYLENFCQDKNIVFEGMEINQKITKNFESEARKIRYQFFKRLKSKYHARFIVTAHHGDDLIETILMRISRGSNLSGYAGIKLVDNEYLHPLLYVDKKEILNYLKQYKIKYFLDKTNNEDHHTRNRYRHHVLQFLKKENKHVHLKYLAFSNKLMEYNDFIDNYIEKNHLINEQTINVFFIQRESDFLIKRCLEKIIIKIQSHDLLDISDKNIDDMLKMIRSSKSNLKINLNNGYIAQREYDIFSIVKDQRSDCFEHEFFDFYESEDWIIKIVKSTDKDDNYVVRLNSSELKMPLVIRSRKNGDKIVVKNLGTKKVKDLFIDEKVKISDRDKWPLVCDSSRNVLFIPGLKKSKFAKDKTEKYDIILLCERKNINEKR